MAITACDEDIMGVYIYLSVEADRIDATEWKDFYAEARAFLTAHPDGILGLRRESVEGTERVVLSRRIERDQDDPSRRHLHVCGDLNSLMTGESFLLYEDIGHDRAGRANRSSGDGADLLNRVLAGENGHMVFSEKTQSWNGWRVKPLRMTAMSRSA